ncbi:unnamed protein product [Pleuronectes platessa]|uniref:Uncharacterized protein n=1 Tax=Pleuronectes platessa TaxID=8262 RepID=A0A9N7U896_PLEPL|nr:unnamed protein product [Pleuronectes platessa]
MAPQRLVAAWVINSGRGRQEQELESLGTEPSGKLENLSSSSSSSSSSSPPPPPPTHIAAVLTRVQQQRSFSSCFTFLQPCRHAGRGRASPTWGQRGETRPEVKTTPGIPVSRRENRFRAVERKRVVDGKTMMLVIVMKKFWILFGTALEYYKESEVLLYLIFITSSSSSSPPPPRHQGEYRGATVPLESRLTDLNAAQHLHGCYGAESGGKDEGKGWRVFGRRKFGSMAKSLGGWQRHKEPWLSNRLGSTPLADMPSQALFTRVRAPVGTLGENKRERDAVDETRAINIGPLASRSKSLHPGCSRPSSSALSRPAVMASESEALSAGP